MRLALLALWLVIVPAWAQDTAAPKKPAAKAAAKKQPPKPHAKPTPAQIQRFEELEKKKAK